MKFLTLPFAVFLSTATFAQVPAGIYQGSATAAGVPQLELSLDTSRRQLATLSTKGDWSYAPGQTTYTIPPLEIRVQPYYSRASHTLSLSGFNFDTVQATNDPNFSLTRLDLSTPSPLLWVSEDVETLTGTLYLSTQYSYEGGASGSESNIPWGVTFHRVATFTPTPTPTLTPTATPIVASPSELAQTVFEIALYWHAMRPRTRADVNGDGTINAEDILHMGETIRPR